MNSLEKIFNSIKSSNTKDMKLFSTRELIKQLKEYDDYILYILKNVYSLISSEDYYNRLCGAKIINSLDRFEYSFNFKLDASSNITDYVYLQFKDIKKESVTDIHKQKKEIKKILSMEHVETEFLEGRDIVDGSVVDIQLKTAEYREKSIENVFDFFEAINWILLSPDWFKRHGGFITYCAIIASANGWDFDKDVGITGNNITASSKNQARLNPNRIKISLSGDIFNKIYEILKNDKFNDFKEDVTSSPVKEAASLLLKYTYPMLDNKLILHEITHLLTNEDWQEQFAALLALSQLKDHFTQDLIDGTGLLENFLDLLISHIESDDEDVKFLCADLLVYVINKFKVPEDKICKIKDMCWEQIEDDIDLAHSKASILILIKTVYSKVKMPVPQSFTPLYPCFTSPLALVRESALELSKIFDGEEFLYLLSEGVLLELNGQYHHLDILKEKIKKADAATLQSLYSHFYKIISGSVHHPYKEDDFACYEDTFFTVDGIKSIGPITVLNNRSALFGVFLGSNCAEFEPSPTILGESFRFLTLNRDESTKRIKTGLIVLETSIQNNMEEYFKKYNTLKKMPIKEFRSIIEDPFYHSLFPLCNDNFVELLRMKACELVLSCDNFDLYFTLENSVEFLKIFCRTIKEHSIEVNSKDNSKDNSKVNDKDNIKVNSKVNSGEPNIKDDDKDDIGEPNIKDNTKEHDNIKEYDNSKKDNDSKDNNNKECEQLIINTVNLLIKYTKELAIVKNNNEKSVKNDDENAKKDKVGRKKDNLDCETKSYKEIILEQAISNVKTFFEVMGTDVFCCKYVFENPERLIFFSHTIQNYLAEGCTNDERINAVFEESLQKRESSILQKFISNIDYNCVIARKILENDDFDLLSDLIDYSDPSFNVIFVKLILKHLYSNSKNKEHLLSKIICTLHFTVNPLIKDTFLIDLIEKEKEEIKMLIDPSYIKDYAVSIPMNIDLRDYQKEGVKWLSFLNRFNLNGILADDMGLGKTVQTLTFVLNEMSLRDDADDKVLILCPSSLSSHWRDEIKNVFGLSSVLHESKSTDSGKIVVSSYDTFRRGSFLETQKWFFVIFDEGHLLKNRNTILYSKCKKLIAKSRVILTGTPIHNSIEDLFSLFNIIMPGYLGDDASFASYYSCKVTDKNVQVMEQRLDALHKKTVPFIMRRLKSDVLKDLPPKIIKDVSIEMNQLQRELYEKIDQGEDYESSKGYNLLKNNSLVKLKDCLKASSHPYYFDKKISSSKTAALLELFEMCENSKVLVFFQFKSTIDYVIEESKVANYLRLDGSVPVSQRGDIVNKFNTEAVQYLFLTTAIGGLGLNLTSADVVIFYEHDWNPFNDLQAMDRAHRLGQKNTVNVFRLICKDTVEEKVMNLQNFKLYVANSLITQQNNEIQKMETKDILEKWL